MESNRAGICCLGWMTIHYQQLAASGPEESYFNKNDRTIRLLLNPAEDDLECYSIGCISFRQHFHPFKFINLPVIPIYVMFTRFDGKYYF
jgi:hypothetical protein